jgi:hypothetical protein
VQASSTTTGGKGGANGGVGSKRFTALITTRTRLSLKALQQGLPEPLERTAGTLATTQVNVAGASRSGV